MSATFDRLPFGPHFEGGQGRTLKFSRGTWEAAVLSQGNTPGARPWGPDPHDWRREAAALSTGVSQSVTRSLHSRWNQHTLFYLITKVCGTENKPKCPSMLAKNYHLDKKHIAQGPTSPTVQTGIRKAPPRLTAILREPAQSCSTASRGQRRPRGPTPERPQAPGPCRGAGQHQRPRSNGRVTTAFQEEGTAKPALRVPCGGLNPSRCLSGSAATGCSHMSCCAKQKQNQTKQNTKNPPLLSLGKKKSM